ncbi:GNAT family N-acetyltransferase [Shewanella sp. TC10]|uniref:GNAT family N-acetyltransferase n=1 Tax=Shewanella sp. TC10 TaxID=1419739 RepID=UPI00129EEC49|nr:GNAT family N-acetyltransferase [Shewanella sp. TC10]
MLIITTQRLTLREFTLEDAEFIYQLMNSPLYLKFIGDRNIKNRVDAKTFLSTKLIPSYQLHGYGLYAVIRNQDDCLIGMCGLVNRDGLEHTDIGFGFLPQYIGMGYGYESARAVTHYANETLSLSPIWAITHPQNTASIKLLIKLGLLYQQHILWGDDQEPILLMSTHEVSSGEMNSLVK